MTKKYPIAVSILPTGDGETVLQAWRGGVLTCAHGLSGFGDTSWSRVYRVPAEDFVMIESHYIGRRLPTRAEGTYTRVLANRYLLLRALRTKYKRNERE